MFKRIIDFLYGIDKYIFDANDPFYKNPNNKQFLKKSLELMYLLIFVYLFILFIFFYFLKI
jgi:hypothetical protein